MVKKNTKYNKLQFPKYSVSEYTDGLIHGVLLKYKKATPADVAAQIHAEVALIKAKADARNNDKLTEAQLKFHKEN
jgi:hypothetical protein